MMLGSLHSATLFLTASAYVVPKITAYVPSSDQVHELEALSTLPLADSNPSSQRRIEVLIGAELYAKVIREGFLQISQNGPIVQETIYRLDIIRFDQRSKYLCKNRKYSALQRARIARRRDTNILGNSRGALDFAQKQSRGRMRSLLRKNDRPRQDRPFHCETAPQPPTTGRSAREFFPYSTLHAHAVKKEAGHSLSLCLN